MVHDASDRAFPKTPTTVRTIHFSKEKNSSQGTAVSDFSAGKSSDCFQIYKLPSARNKLMRRQTPVESRAPISPGLLPIFSMNKYAPVFVGNSITANMNWVRYMFNPNSDMLRHIPKYVI